MLLKYGFYILIFFFFGMNQDKLHGILLPSTNSMSGKILALNLWSELLLINQIGDSLIYTISWKNEWMIMIF